MINENLDGGVVMLEKGNQKFKKGVGRGEEEKEEKEEESFEWI